MWVDQLHWTLARLTSNGIGDGYGPHLRVYRGALHPVEDVSDLFQIGDVGTVWIRGSAPRRTLGERVDEEFLNATRLDLEVKFICDGVEPTLNEDAD